MPSMIGSLMQAKEVALDTETSGASKAEALDALRCGLKGVSLAWRHKGEPVSHYWSFNPEEMPPHEARDRWKSFTKDILVPLFNRRALILIYHNASFDIKVLRSRGFMPKARIADTMLESYLLDENISHSLDDCARRELGDTKVMSHTQLLKRQNEIRQEALKKIKDIKNETWIAYRDFQKGQTPLHQIRPAVRSLITQFPAKMLKDRIFLQVQKHVGRYLLQEAEQNAISLFHEYGRKDALLTLKLHEVQLPKLIDEGFGSLFWNLYMPNVLTAMEMDWAGVRVDLKQLKKVQAFLRGLRENAVKKIAAKLGPDFNINSPPQMKKLLWEDMKLEPPPWISEQDISKDGTVSTGEDILEWLADNKKIPLLKDIIFQRKIDKALSTYADPLIEQAERDPENRIHTTFSIMKVTGRWGSSNPNVQNQPRDDTLEDAMPGCPSVRAAFVAPEGKKLLVGDYSQIDLRGVAHASREPSFWHGYRSWKCLKCKNKGETHLPLHACPVCGEADNGGKGKFTLGIDVHMKTAIDMGIIKKYPKKIARFHAKKTNFGFVYLMYFPTLAKQLDISNEQAKVYYDKWHAQRPGIRAYANRLESQIFRDGFFRFVNGQKRRFTRDIKVIRSLERQGTDKAYKEAKRRRHALMREAMNNTGQGNASCVINTAIRFLRNHREFMAQHGLRLLMQVHDELVFEVDEKHAEAMRVWVRDLMESAGVALKFSVPVLAEVGIGRTWTEAK